MDLVPEHSDTLNEPPYRPDRKRRTSFRFTHVKNTPVEAAAAATDRTDGITCIVPRTPAALLSHANASPCAHEGTVRHTAQTPTAVAAGASLVTESNEHLLYCCTAIGARTNMHISNDMHTDCGNANSSSSSNNNNNNNSSDGMDVAHANSSNDSCISGTSLAESAEESFLRAQRTDSSQRLAASFDSDSPLLIQAGAGSGKTQTMAMRMAVLLLRGVPAGHLLGICFTRQAAETLRQRVELVLPIRLRACAKALKLKTMHAFGLECLRQYGAIDAQTEVYDGVKQRALVRRVVREHAAAVQQQDASDAVDELMDYINRTKTRAQADSTGRSAEEEVSHESQAGHLYRLYQHALHVECHAVDFGDLLHMFLALLRSTTATAANVHSSDNSNRGANSEDTKSSRSDALQSRAHTSAPAVSPVCLALRRQYTHIVVDEFQDFNEVQMEILAQLGGEACRVTCVGDPNQCIYGWRGAVASGFTQWRQRFRQTALHTLAVNYRSVPAIVSVLNRVVRSQQRAAAMPFRQNNAAVDSSSCRHGSSSSSSSSKRTWSIDPCNTTRIDGQNGRAHLHRGDAASTKTDSHTGHTIRDPDSHVDPSDGSIVDAGSDGPDDAVVLVQCPTDADELRAVADMIGDVLPARHPRYARHRSAMAVLCRTRRHVQSVCAALRARHIPTREMKTVAPDAISPLRALLAHVRLCIDAHGVQSNEEIRVALTMAPHRLSARTAKSFFFSLEAVYRERGGSSSLSSAAVAAATVCEDWTIGEGARCVGKKEMMQAGVVGEVAHSNSSTRSGSRDGNDCGVLLGNEYRTRSRPLSSSSSTVSYFSILCELVYHNFAPGHLPKLRLPRSGQKVVRHLVCTLTRAHGLLTEHAPPTTHALWISEGDVIEEVLSYIVAAGGFDDHNHSNSSGCMGGSKHSRSVRTERAHAKRHGSSVCETLAAEVAAEMSHMPERTRAASLSRQHGSNEGNRTNCDHHHHHHHHHHRSSTSDAAETKSYADECTRAESGSCHFGVNSEVKRAQRVWGNDAVEYTAAEEKALLAQTEHSLLRLLQRAYATVRQSFCAHHATHGEDGPGDEQRVGFACAERGPGHPGRDVTNKRATGVCDITDLGDMDRASDMYREDWVCSPHGAKLSRDVVSPALLLRCVLDELTNVTSSDNFGSLQFAAESTASQANAGVSPSQHVDAAKQAVPETKIACSQADNHLPVCSSVDSVSDDDGSCNDEQGSNLRGWDDCVTVTTVHQAKGMEWPIVLISGCWVGEFPVNKRSEEERRVFYVAMSRAKSHLVLFTAKCELQGEDCLQAANDGPALERTPYIASFEKSIVKMSYDASTHRFTRDTVRT